jgi:hypothetical protein
MQSATKPTGSAPLDSLTINHAKPFSSATPQLPSFSSVHAANPAARSFAVGRLARFTHHEHQQIQRRCLAAAAQAKAAARRRTLIALALCLMGMAVGVTVIQRDAQMQGQMVEALQ